MNSILLFLDPSPRHAFRVTASSHIDVTTIVLDDQFETQFIVHTNEDILYTMRIDAQIFPMLK